jgi:DNA-binding NtrC family response regulator
LRNPSANVPILVVDDDAVARQLLANTLEEDGYAIDFAANGAEALEKVKTTRYAVVLSDVEMAPINGLELLKTLREMNSEAIPLLITGYGTLSGAVSAIHSGAFDYLSKPFRPPLIRQSVRRAVGHWRTRLKKGFEEPASQALPSLVGCSPVMVNVYRTLALASLSESNVLILGESGTGKELVARAIYQYSERKNAPFVAVNCSSLSESLLESELFGHMKGSFTGATANKAGLFDSADGGTLFLDEIGDISPGTQVRLLRALQEGEIKPVGNNEAHKVNVRVIAATHRDLRDRVEKGLFREDLYYRLKVLEIEIPPLRARLEDLPSLVRFFIRRHQNTKHSGSVTLSEEAIHALKTRFWPGNVRELEHAVQQALTLSQGRVLYPEDFPSNDSRAEDRGLALPSLDPTLSLDDVEKRHIQGVLQATGFNKTRSATILGIDRATLYRKARKYLIDLDRKSG